MDYQGCAHHWTWLTPHNHLLIIKYSFFNNLINSLDQHGAVSHANTSIRKKRFNIKSNQRFNTNKDFVIRSYLVLGLHRPHHRSRLFYLQMRSQLYWVPQRQWTNHRHLPHVSRYWTRLPDISKYTHMSLIKYLSDQKSALDTISNSWMKL